MKIQILVVVTLSVLGSCDALTFDCNSGDQERENYIHIAETDPVNTVLLVVNNSYGDLHWKASINGTNEDYLSLFFESSPTEGADHTHALIVAKVLDLELLQLELVSSEELFAESGDAMVTVDLSVFCNGESREVNEWNFKINIRSVNEFYPQFIGSPFRAAVSESSVVGSAIFNIGSKATDLDAGQTNLTFAIAPYMITQFDGRDYVTMDRHQKGDIVLAKSLDFESFLNTGRTYMFVNITATDDGGFTSATSVNLSVTDINDQGIQLVYPECLRPCLRVNYSATTNESFVGQLEVGPFAILAQDLDTLNDSVMYTLVSDADKEFFDIDESTGKLFKTAPLINDSYGFSIQVQVHAQETTDDDHFLDFNVTVFILERLPKPRSTF